MIETLNRRMFLQAAAAAPFLQPVWRTKPPAAYLDEVRLLMRYAPVPGAVIGAVEGGKPAWIAPLGVQSVETREPVDPATLFQAASLTKQLTAYAAFALRGQGKLDFDRPLVAYLDDLKNPLARKVTARHVLSQSSGFPNWRYTEKPKETIELVPEFEPGSKYQYSGEGFFYLQRVFESITDRGFGQVIQDLVLDPLGMTSSTLVWDPQTLSRTALPHHRHGEPREHWDKAALALRQYAAKAGKPVSHLRYEEYAQITRDAGDPVLPNWMLPNAAASLVTSAEDYARFLCAAINSEIAQQQTSINEFLGWGLGWAVERTAGRRYVWQWGDNSGYKNFVVAEPQTRSGIFVFTNGDSGTRIYERVITRATGHEHPALFWV